MAVVGMRRTLALPRIDRRVVLGVALAALAAFLVLATTQPPTTVPVLVAASDLPAGVPLDGSHVSVRNLSSGRGLVEGDSIGELAGWTLAAPLGAGEPLLASLLRPPQMLDDPNQLALAVPESQAVLGTIAAGDLIDVYVTWDSLEVDSVTELLAADVFVVEARVDENGVGADRDVQILVAVDDDLALDLTRASHGGELDIVKVSP